MKMYLVVVCELCASRLSHIDTDTDTHLPCIVSITTMPIVFKDTVYFNYFNLLI